jgi:hypothetical protein
MAGTDKRNKGEAFEAYDDIPLNTHLEATLGGVLMQRYGRRAAVKSLLAVTAATILFGPLAADGECADNLESRFRFAEAAAGNDTGHHLADGHKAQILLRWGDPVFADAVPFDPTAQTHKSQLTQFGYNNDFIGFVPLDENGARALLCVNHEFTNEEVMFPGIGVQHRKNFADMTAELAAIEMAAHGGTIIEIELKGGIWTPVLDSRYNRRITPISTEMSADGPAAGHARLKTASDPSGHRIIGTLNNCAGGITPWGTYLMAEENFHGYFWTDRMGEDGKRLRNGLGGPQQNSYARYGVPGNWYNWGQYHDRFNVDREPNEPNRFGWIVEVDPADPASTPVKHTALGRFRHEGSECVLSQDGHAVIFMGDDARFDYLYRFVSAATFTPGDKKANMSLLAEGTLSVARFDADGTVTWLPLRFGDGPLTPQNGFESEADVLIDARLAADALEATPMDRPEDVQPNPINGRIYVMLTNNKKRTSEQEDAANPRANNWLGHVVEMTPPDGNYTATTYNWDILVKCGNPAIAGVGALWNPKTTQDGWFAAPDNCAVDGNGRLWIATDQGKNRQRTGKADGLYGVETDGPLRGHSKLFFRCPVGAELCGPCFAPDGETLFVSVQHPGTDGTQYLKGFERQSTFEDPATRWPDFDPKMPPRPAVLAIRKSGGGPVGT